jgi:carbon-monoxide dehydrogenase large subunit
LPINYGYSRYYGQRDDVAAAVLGVPSAAVRVVSGDIGGNVGIRNNTYPEFALVAWAAKRIGRPIKWSCERRDAFATDFPGREHALNLRWPS